jgi:hypothetical protein
MLRKREAYRESRADVFTAECFGGLLNFRAGSSDLLLGVNAAGTVEVTQI